MLKQIRRLALNDITVLLNASSTASARLGQNDINQSNPHSYSLSLGEGKINLLLEGRRKVAFTLAEVLITIGIIGVVAAMTIPSLMHNIRTKELESKFKKAHSTVAQLSRIIQNDDISLDNNDYINAAFNDILIKYLPGAVYCGIGWSGSFKNIKGCPKTSTATADSYYYHNYSNTAKATNSLIDDGTYFLKDGSNLYLENPTQTPRVAISIDLNGYQKGPNRWGYDIFMWELKDYTFVPMGLSGTLYPSNTYCSKTSTSGYNGAGCAALTANDPDYFKNLPRF